MKKPKKPDYYLCPKCHHKTVLASAIICEFEPDSMPYADNQEEEIEDGDGTIWTEVNVGIHYCEKCDKLVDAWIEEPYDNGYGRVCRALDLAKRRIAKLKAENERLRTWGSYCRCSGCKAIVVNSGVCHKCGQAMIDADVIVPELEIVRLEAKLTEYRQAAQAVLEDLAIASETWRDSDAGPDTVPGEPRDPNTLDVTVETQEAIQTALALDRKPAAEQGKIKFPVHAVGNGAGLWFVEDTAGEIVAGAISTEAEALQRADEMNKKNTDAQTCVVVKNKD